MAEAGSSPRRHQPQCPWKTDASRTFVLPEEVLKRYTCGLLNFLWLPVQHPSALANEGGKLSSLSGIASQRERQIQRRQDHLPETAAFKNPPDPRRIAPTELVGFLGSQWCGRRHEMMDRRYGSRCPWVFRSRPEHSQQQPSAPLHPVSNVAEGSHGIGKKHHAKPAETKVDG